MFIIIVFIYILSKYIRSKFVVVYKWMMEDRGKTSNLGGKWMKMGARGAFKIHFCRGMVGGGVGATQTLYIYNTKKI